MPGSTFENARPTPKRRQQKNEARKRPRDADIEQDPLAADRRPDADERAERAGHRHRRGQKNGSVASTP
jgi:hypothetical protein